jgi:uncharacterized membrane protein (UPF0182 family)
MEETLERALDRLFPSGERDTAARPAASPAAPGADSPAETSPAQGDALAARARAHYERAIQAQKEGNWALYGEEIRQLGEVLNEMNRRQ